MELWKIRRQVRHFSIFSILEHNGKNEKMVRINIFFSFFRFPIFGGKWKNRKNELGIEDYFIFLAFQTISKIKNSKISLLAVYTVFCIFEEDFKTRKKKK